MQYLYAAFFFTACWLPASAAADVIYKCKNPQGGTLYQEKPCADAASAVAAWGSASGAALVIGQGSHGHYAVDGTINDHALNFIVDTGASVVTLPQGSASAAGLRCQRQTTLRTGNGNTSACMTTIQKLKFGAFTFKDVEAIIAPNLDQPLLGMNVLKKFRIEQDSGEMRLSRRE